MTAKLIDKINEQPTINLQEQEKNQEKNVQSLKKQKQKQAVLLHQNKISKQLSC